MGGLQARLTLLLLASAVMVWLAHAALTHWPLPGVLQALQRLGWALQAPQPWSLNALTLTLLLVLPLAAATAAWATAPLLRLINALQGAVLGYRDGDFNTSIGGQAGGELGELLRLHRELGGVLRDQRRTLAQRELMLDTVVQHSPLALLLTDAEHRIVYNNLVARQWLAHGRSLVGQPLARALAQAPAALAEALQAGRDQLVNAEVDGQTENFHVSQRALSLHGAPHHLLLLRRMTRELAREEVAAWKRVIRVISHELNNSLAPISSLAHSGAELARRGQVDKLPRVFETIAERSAHLHSFLAGYAEFAKLPKPRLEPVDWAEFVDGLQSHSRFMLQGPLPPAPGRFDAGQVAQALINLLKNAVEAGGAPEAVTLQVLQRENEHHLCVADRGRGMTEAVMAQALLPFYSTKRSGTGLGLALAREIAEAHGGRIHLAKRPEGGLAVTLVLPA